MVKLIIEDDEGKTTVVPLIRDEITIGRKEGNTIRLTERNVSRRHARLVKQNGGAIFIEDLNSYNGIKVNGNRISGRVAVAEGDRIQIGDYVLGLKLEGAVEAAARAAEARTVELPRPEEAPTETDLAGPTSARAAIPAPQPKPRTGEAVGRLVCVSTNFPGEEWFLDKPVMVIGRTEDNDIVVNHRSISRHHARVVEEHGRYTIVDLQSSNGVRVNGEEYGKVELRRGDLIDLGHVRLRFVAPGEEFVFSPASVVDISKPSGGHGVIWIAAVVLVLLVAGALVWKFVPSGGTQAADTGSGTQATSGSAAGGGDREQTQLMTELRDAVGNEQWATAVGLCEKLRGNPAAQADCHKAELEKNAKEAFDKAFAAAVANRDIEAVRAWKQIPDGSAYKQRDRDVIDRARDKALVRLRSDLRDAVADNACQRARALASDIKELDPSDSEAESTAAGCSAAVAGLPDNKTKVKKPPRKIPPKKVEVKVPAKVPAVDPAAARAQADQLVQQAQSAYASGNHALSSKLAKQAVKLVPGHAMATQILGASACYLKNEREAKAAYERLQTGPRNLLRSVCRQVGINLQ